jgi:hypothetical protein
LVLPGASAATFSDGGAGPLTTVVAGNCLEPTTRPFLPWLDPARYALVSDGGFETGGQGWRLQGATVVEGNEPYYVRARGDRRSLALPAGSSATSPDACVGLLHPTARFFARNDAAEGSLLIEALVHTPLGQLALPVDLLAAGKRFQPTPPLSLLANLTAPLAQNGSARMAIRLTALGGSWYIDELYIDPFRVR